MWLFATLPSLSSTSIKSAANFVNDTTMIKNERVSTPCKTKDGEKVTCGPCEKCSERGCVPLCAECEECQAGVCVFSKPGYCYGPSLSKCYKAGEFFHRKGIDSISICEGVTFSYVLSKVLCGKVLAWSAG